MSVERLLDPSLVGQPVVVGGRRGSRGVVTAASYEVRPLGVRSGMPMGEAVRLAPNAIFLPTRHGVYTPYATRVKEVLQRYTPVVRTASIDEFFLDFAGCEELYRRPWDLDDDATITRIVWEMRDAIQAEVGLPASAGIGATRAVAKIASGRAKPAGVLMVVAGTERRFADPLPVRKFPGIGPVAEARLAEEGVHTLGELLAVPSGPRRTRLLGLIEAVYRGLDPGEGGALGRDRPAFQEHDPVGLAVGSISNERTFYVDLGDRLQVEEQLRNLCERVCWRARKRDIRARTITLKLRYTDFDTISRSISGPPTNVESEVLGIVLGLARRAWTRPLGVRLLGVALSNLVGPDRQLLLPCCAPQRPGPARAIDEVRLRFGYDAIRLGAAPASREAREPVTSDTWLA